MLFRYWMVLPMIVAITILCGCLQTAANHLDGFQEACFVGMKAIGEVRIGVGEFSGGGSSFNIRVHQSPMPTTEELREVLDIAGIKDVYVDYSFGFACTPLMRPSSMDLHTNLPMIESRANAAEGEKQMYLPRSKVAIDFQLMFVFRAANSGEKPNLKAVLRSRIVRYWDDEDIQQFLLWPEKGYTWLAGVPVFAPLPHSSECGRIDGRAESAAPWAYTYVDLGDEQEFWAASMWVRGQHDSPALVITVAEGRYPDQTMRMVAPRNTGDEGENRRGVAMKPSN